MTQTLHPRAVAREIARGAATNPATIRRHGRRVGLGDEQAARLPEIVIEIRAVRAARAAARGHDPLGFGAPGLRGRLESRRLLRRADRERAARKTLLAAARVARRLGFRVRASTGRAGRVSSYYCDPCDGRRPLRISDHAIPATARRDAVAEHYGHGSFDGYPGPELVIGCARSATWLRRAILLATAGRDVPGAGA